MQTFKILLRQPETETPEKAQSQLISLNDYLVYSSEVDGKLVNDLNVRVFLDNQDNVALTNSFLQYLSASSDRDEFNKIVNDNKKLANVLNDFYESTLSQEQNPNRLLIQSAVTDTKRIVFTPNVFLENGKRKKIKLSVLTEISTEESFYVPIAINRKSETISPLDFSEFTRDCIEDNEQGEPTLFVQCFIDLDKRKDPFEDVPAPIK